MILVAICLPLVARIELFHNYAWLSWAGSLVMLIAALVIAVRGFQRHHLTEK